MKWTRSRIVVITALAIAGCSSSDSHDHSNHPELIRSGPVRHYDSAGVEIVDNGSRNSELLTSVTESLRLGGRDATGPTVFFQVRGVAVGPDGTIYIGNRTSGTVKVFTSQGRFVREFGGIGEGPREVSVGLDRVWLSGDDIVVADDGASELIVFSKIGQALATWSPGSPSKLPKAPLSYGPQGWLILDSRDVKERPFHGGSLGTRRDFLRAHASADDSIGVVLVRFPPRVTLFEDKGSRTEPLFATDPWTRWGIDAEGRVHVAGSGGYAIDLYSEKGRHLRRIKRTVESRPITGADVEELKTTYPGLLDAAFPRMGEAERRSSAQAFLETLEKRSEIPLPAEMPALRSILVGSDGTVWAERTLESPARMEFENWLPTPVALELSRPSRWDLYDTEGTFLGSVDLPPTFRPMAVLGRSVYGVMRDELDPEAVVRMEAEQ